MFDSPDHTTQIIKNTIKNDCNDCDYVDADKEFSKSIKYAQERIQFNVPIASFGAIKQKLAKMVVQTFSCESICYRAGDDIEKKIIEFQNKGKSLI